MGQIIVDERGRAITPDNRFPVDVGGTVQLSGSNAAVIEATIANGASLSGTLDLGALTLVGVILPAAWTAAVITFAVSHDGVTFVPLRWQGAEFTLAGAAASVALAVEPSALFPWRFVRIRSGTNAVGVNQGAERKIQVLAKPV